MDAISAVLQPYRETIGQSTGLLTALQMLSGSLLLNDIRRHGAVRASDSIVPFLGGLVLSTIGLRFGVALGDDTTIRTNFFGVALHVAYVTFFYWYTPGGRKTAVWAQVGAGGGLAAAVVAYAAWEQEELLAARLGMLMFAFVFALVSMPFLGLVSGWRGLLLTAIRTKQFIGRMRDLRLLMANVIHIMMLCCSNSALGIATADALTCCVIGESILSWTESVSGDI